MNERDVIFMRRALELAERGWGTVQPNPMVGAVVVRDGEIAGAGWHERFGGPHAEVVALNATQGSTAGATLYVTLEPCSHHGKTPPCTDAIIAAGITRVVYAGEDPNPDAAGGANRLREAGIEAEGGIERDAARRLNGAFYHTHEHNSPYVALKLALSLDGRISAHRDAPTAITGPEATAEVHRMRAGYDAVMVGIGTALSDDPRLTVRGEITPRVPPARVVVDSRLSLPVSSKLVTSTAEAPVIVLTSEDSDPAAARALTDAGALVVRVPQDRTEPGLDVHGILTALWEQGIRSVLCEGGSRLAGSLLDADAVHRLTLFYAPVLLGPAAVPAIEGAVSLTEPDWAGPWVRHFGRDIAVTFDRMRATTG